tara:strand:+ start:1986 stop:2165 length:180 start_codon:yes stop_codon:yes gene_type:complete
MSAWTDFIKKGGYMKKGGKGLKQASIDYKKKHPKGNKKDSEKKMKKKEEAEAKKKKGKK